MYPIDESKAIKEMKKFQTKELEKKRENLISIVVSQVQEKLEEVKQEQEKKRKRKEGSQSIQASSWFEKAKDNDEFNFLSQNNDNELLEEN